MGEPASNAYRVVLEQKRDRAAKELAELTRPREAGADISFGKRIGEGTTEAVERISTTAAARVLAGVLADLDRALAKLDEGTFGICDDCGAAIGAQRLEAKPSSTTCVTCSARRQSR